MLPKPLKIMEPIASVNLIDPVIPIQVIQPVQPQGFSDFIKQQEEYNKYEDPMAITSLSDVLFNIAGKRERLDQLDTPYIPGISEVILGVDYLKNNFAEPLFKGEYGKLAYNTLMSVGEDLDLLANPVKGLMLDGAKGLLRATFGDAQGRKQYDYDTGNWGADLALEIVSDPLVWFTLGGNLVAKATAKPGAKSVTSILKESLDAKDISKIYKQAAKIKVTQDPERLIKAMQQLKVPQELQAQALNTLATDSWYKISKSAYGIAKAADNVDNIILKSALLVSPVGVAKLGFKASKPVIQFLTENANMMKPLFKSKESIVPIVNLIPYFDTIDNTIKKIAPSLDPDDVATVTKHADQIKQVELDKHAKAFTEILNKNKDKPVIEVLQKITLEPFVMTKELLTQLDSVSPTNKLMDDFNSVLKTMNVDKYSMEELDTFIRQYNITKSTDGLPAELFNDINITRTVQEAPKLKRYSKLFKRDIDQYDDIVDSFNQLHKAGLKIPEANTQQIKSTLDSLNDFLNIRQPMDIIIDNSRTHIEPTSIDLIEEAYDNYVQNLLPDNFSTQFHDAFMNLRTLIINKDQVSLSRIRDSLLQINEGINMTERSILNRGDDLLPVILKEFRDEVNQALDSLQTRLTPEVLSSMEDIMIVQMPKRLSRKYILGNLTDRQLLWVKNIATDGHKAQETLRIIQEVTDGSMHPGLSDNIDNLINNMKSTWNYVSLNNTLASNNPNKLKVIDALNDTTLDVLENINESNGTGILIDTLKRGELSPDFKKVFTDRLEYTPLLRRELANNPAIAEVYDSYVNGVLLDVVTDYIMKQANVSTHLLETVNGDTLDNIKELFENVFDITTVANKQVTDTVNKRLQIMAQEIYRVPDIEKIQTEFNKIEISQIADLKASGGGINVRPGGSDSLTFANSLYQSIHYALGGLGHLRNYFQEFPIYKSDINKYVQEKGYQHLFEYAVDMNPLGFKTIYRAADKLHFNRMVFADLSDIKFYQLNTKYLQLLDNADKLLESESMKRLLPFIKEEVNVAKGRALLQRYFVIDPKTDKEYIIMHELLRKQPDTQFIYGKIIQEIKDKGLYNAEAYDKLIALDAFRNDLDDLVNGDVVDPDSLLERIENNFPVDDIGITSKEILDSISEFHQHMIPKSNVSDLKDAALPMTKALRQGYYGLKKLDNVFAIDKKMSRNAQRTLLNARVKQTADAILNQSPEDLYRFINHEANPGFIRIVKNFDKYPALKKVLDNIEDYRKAGLDYYANKADVWIYKAQDLGDTTKVVLHSDTIVKLPNEFDDAVDVIKQHVDYDLPVDETLFTPTILDADMHSRLLGDVPDEVVQKMLLKDEHFLLDKVRFNFSLLGDLKDQILAHPYISTDIKKVYTVGAVRTVRRSGAQLRGMYTIMNNHHALNQFEFLEQLDDLNFEQFFKK